MPAKQQEKQPAVPRVQDAVIGNHVLDALGLPPTLHRVQVRRLWGDYYRVNVFVGGDAASVTVAHSFFLTTDGEGNISACNPKILKQY